MLLVKASPSNYSRVNWAKWLSCCDAFLDDPIPQLFPWLFAAFPNARVVHTTRDPVAWVQSRMRNHPGAPLPLSGLYARPLSGFDRDKATKADWSYLQKTLGEQAFESVPHFAELAVGSAPTLPAAIMYTMETSFVSCVVPPDQYYPIDVTRGELCGDDAIRALSAFLRMSPAKNSAHIGCAQGRTNAQWHQL